MTIQPLQALVVANVRRQQCAALRGQVIYCRTSEGARMALADILRFDHEPLANRMLWDVLGWIPRITETERVGVMRHAGVFDHYRTISRLSERQLRAAAYALENPGVWKRRGQAA